MHKQLCDIKSHEKEINKEKVVGLVMELAL